MENFCSDTINGIFKFRVYALIDFYPWQLTNVQNVSWNILKIREVICLVEYWNNNKEQERKVKCVISSMKYILESGRRLILRSWRVILRSNFMNKLFSFLSFSLEEKVEEKTLLRVWKVEWKLVSLFPVC